MFFIKNPARVAICTGLKPVWAGICHGHQGHIFIEKQSRNERLRQGYEAAQVMRVGWVTEDADKVTHWLAQPERSNPPNYTFLTVNFLCTLQKKYKFLTCVPPYLPSFVSWDKGKLDVRVYIQQLTS